MKTTVDMSDSEQFSAQRRRVLLGMAATGAAIAGSSLSCPAMAANEAAQVTTAPSSVRIRRLGLAAARPKRSSNSDSPTDTVMVRVSGVAGT